MVIIRRNARVASYDFPAGRQHSHTSPLSNLTPANPWEGKTRNFVFVHIGKCVYLNWKMNFPIWQNISVKLAANTHCLYLTLHQRTTQRGKQRTKEFWNVFVHVGKCTSQTLEHPTRGGKYIIQLVEFLFPIIHRILWEEKLQYHFSPNLSLNDKLGEKWSLMNIATFV